MKKYKNVGKRILFCGNGMSAEIIKNVKDLGYTVYVLTDFVNDYGLQFADKVVFVETKNPMEALKASQQLAREGYIFDGVMSLCWDCPLSVSTIARAFNLKSVSWETAHNSSIKSLRSEIFRNNDVPSPGFKIVKNLKDLENAVDEIKFPIVLKPIDRSSCKGVIYVENKADLLPAYQYSLSYTSSESIIVNEYVCGTEHSTEGLMINGCFYPTAISDRIFHYSTYKPYFVESGDIMPTYLDNNTIKSMFTITEKAAVALGIDNGVVKGDLIFTKNQQIKVFEITPRLGGPRFGTEMVPLSNGTRILYAAIQQALGESINKDYLIPKFNRGMVNRSVFPTPGTIKSIQGLNEIKKMPGYYDFKWWSPKPLEIGDQIKEYKNTGGIGYFICTGKSRENAIFNADNIENKIKILTDY